MPVNCDDPTEVENAAQAALIRKLADALLVVRDALTAAREAGMAERAKDEQMAQARAEDDESSGIPRFRVFRHVEPPAEKVIPNTEPGTLIRDDDGRWYREVDPWECFVLKRRDLRRLQNAGLAAMTSEDRVNWDALSCIHGCDPTRHPVVGIYALNEGCVVHRTDRLQALCLQHFVSAKDGAIGGLVTVVDRLEEQRDDT